MADYDQATNIYTLTIDEAIFAIPPNPAGGLGADVVGNALDNLITGNNGANSIGGGAGDDTLNGSDGDDTLDGGLGNDILVGGDDNDTYVVNSILDEVQEALGQGIDTVHASVSFTLSDDVEKLILTGITNLDGVGNELDNVITGNAGNNHLDGGLGADVLTGGLGTDIYVVDDAGDVVVELDDQGVDTIHASINIDLAQFANVEIVVLTGDDDLNATGDNDSNELYGNAGDNLLIGGGGSDVINGNEGADEMIGGDGDDFYYVDDGMDIVTEAFDEGIDSVASTITFSFAGLADIENLYLYGDDEIDATGNGLANNIEGNSAKNHLIGGGGSDRLEGGGGEDILEGGLGDDIYFIDNIGVTLTELAGQGTNDAVSASISFTLDAEFEQLQLRGSRNINGTGNDAANTILGNDGANRLDGKGGADELKGGLGNDVYVLGDGDHITEVEDEGTDTVEITDAFTGSDYALLDHFENLTLTGTRNFNGTGNAANNFITGNSGVNILDGGAGEDTLIGGAGSDVMIGGSDNDLYLIDSSSDVATEEAGGGTFDRVIAKVSYILGANIEYLALENNAGNINATGNALDNTISGNDGNNIVDGAAGRDQLTGATGNDTVHGGGDDDTINESGDGNDALYGDAGNDDIRAEGGNDILDGGIGADILAGGAGNDTYMVDNALDVVKENVGEGVDSLTASVSFALSADASIETLSALAGGAAINLSGNALDNTINGNSGANALAGGAGNDFVAGLLGNDIVRGEDGSDALDGGVGNDKLNGGAGKDRLTGGLGKDVFVFDSALSKLTNLDTIVEFKMRDDSFHLDNAIFRKVGKGTESKPGKLSAKFFKIGTKAADKDDHVIYNKAKGVIYYDSDGTGKAKQTEFAVVKKNLALTLADFFVI